jgi:hypothetical protein
VKVGFITGRNAMEAPLFQECARAGVEGLIFGFQNAFAAKILCFTLASAADSL